MQSKMKNEKSGFGSKLGFILAAAGSAVGLGNIWRFPYLAAEYGGGIFLLVYLVLAVTFGFTLMVTEIAIGRRTGKSVINAYSSVNKKFAPLGWLAGAVPVIILPYYCVIGGWVLKYFTSYAAGVFTSDTNSSEFFTDFIGHFSSPMIFFVIYVILTAVIVMLGVKKGIEMVSKIMMPVLLLLIIGIGIYTLTLDGAWEGFTDYYLYPDFSKFSIKTVVAAMGQLFYSMSLAMGIMITYGSYMRKEDNIEGSVRHIEIFDTAVAFLAGMIVVPAVFAFSSQAPEVLSGEMTAEASLEANLKSGPGLMFMTLPNVFGSVTGGRILGIVFFLLVALAALTSSISLMETVVAMISEKFKVKRIASCLIVIGITLALGTLSVLGYSLWSTVKLFGMQLLDFFDFTSNNIMMPLVALFTCILVGFVVKTKYIEDEVELNAKFKSKQLYRVMVKYICPICMIAILVTPFIVTL